MRRQGQQWPTADFSLRPLIHDGWVSAKLIQPHVWCLWSTWGDIAATPVGTSILLGSELTFPMITQAMNGFYSLNCSHSFTTALQPLFTSTPLPFLHTQCLYTAHKSLSHVSLLTSNLWRQMAVPPRFWFCQRFLLPTVAKALGHRRSHDCRVLSAFYFYVVQSI